MGTQEIMIAIIAAIVWLFYAGHILVFTLGWTRLIRKKKESFLTPRTSLTVMVALRDEKEHVRPLLELLRLQDYPADRYEVILVDDHSVDGTAEVIRGMLGGGGFEQFRMLSMAERGLAGSKKAALEAGIAEAKGKLVVVTDADCRMGSGWLRTVAGAYERAGSRMVAGAVVPEMNAKGLSGAFQALEFLSLVGSGAGAIGAGKAIYCNGANMAFSRDAFYDVGGFSGNEEYLSGDDVFLLHKIKKKFGPGSIGFVMDREALVTTMATQGWKGFFRQRIRWASKTRGYRDIFSITTALSVFLVNLALFVLLLTGIFLPAGLLVFCVLFIMKMMTDLPLMMGITSYFGRGRLMYWFVLFEALYIFYVIVAGMVSIFYGGSWKGREVRMSSQQIKKQVIEPTKTSPPGPGLPAG